MPTPLTDSAYSKREENPDVQEKFGFVLWEKIKKATTSFSPRERIVFFLLVFIFITSALGILGKVNKLLLIEIQAYGGILKEGVIGTPRFINPVLELSDADRDLTLLIYSGLLRATPEGVLIPDLAEDYSISEDGLTYTFNLKKNLSWHDGQPLTSDDVVFTITKIQDNILKSPKRASWEGIEAKKIDDETIQFILKQEYAPFLENTTVGILPKHLWGDISALQFGFSRLNVWPIGSGPFKVKKIKEDSSGVPYYYELVSFKHFSLKKPYINEIQIKFYANEEDLLEAFEKGNIDAVNAIGAKKARGLTRQNVRVETYILPRVFGVFFNQNQNIIFADHSVRNALNYAIDRRQIIEKVLFGFATAIDGPLPPGSLGFTPIDPINKGNGLVDNATTTSIERAREILQKAGWKLNEETGIREKKSKERTQILQFSIATSDAEELKSTVRIIKNTWEALGARVELKIYNTGDLNQNIIRPRKYDALFFGEIIGRESDPFAFWHSSQMNDPGLNIALYANITTDKLLEVGRVIFDREKRVEIYKQFNEEVSRDIPAVFVYSPDFIYILPQTIKGSEAGTITIPSERFLDIHKWYIKTDKVWRIFAN